MKVYLKERDLSYVVASETNQWYPTKHLDGIPRIVVPAQSIDGAEFWQARAMIPTLETKRWRSATGSKEGSIVVCWPKKILGSMKLIIVEGPMDALAAATAEHLGFAAMGKINLKDVIAYIKAEYRFHIDYGQIVIVPDLDYPDFGAEACRELALVQIHSQVRLPESEDLAAMKNTARKKLLA